jgi:hypothetical protein
MACRLSQVKCQVYCSIGSAQLQLLVSVVGRCEIQRLYKLNYRQTHPSLEKEINGAPIYSQLTLDDAYPFAIF